MVYSVPGGSVVKVNDGNKFIRLDSEQEKLDICPVSPNRHPLKTGSRSEYEARDDHSDGTRNAREKRKFTQIRDTTVNTSCPQLSAEVGL